MENSTIRDYTQDICVKDAKTGNLHAQRLTTVIRSYYPQNKGCQNDDAHVQ